MRHLIIAFATLTVITAYCSAGISDDQQWRADGKNVLVVYLDDGPDRQAAGKSDSRQVAEYYAMRRGIPEENLLSLKLQEKGKADKLLYRDFFEMVLQPVSAKLKSKAADGKTFADRVCYIAICPDIPMRVDTAQTFLKEEKSQFKKTPTRSLDSFLINIDSNLNVGVNEKTGGAGFGSGGMLGAIPEELIMPFYGQYALPKPQHFRQLRQDAPLKYNFYLVNRLGVDLTTARNMIDGGLYAERFLRLPGADEKTNFRPAIWLDQKYSFQAADQVAAMSQAVAIVQGYLVVRRTGTGAAMLPEVTIMKISPFADGKGLHQVWPLVIDSQSDEIGLLVYGKQHKPTVTAKIMDVDDKGLTLGYPAIIINTPRQKVVDVPGVLYFPPGCVVSYEPPSSASKPATTPATTTAAATQSAVVARIVGINPEKNRLLLDSTSGFAKGGTVRYDWQGEFPTDNCFIFYGFYGLSQYEDVFKFLPGAVGIHVDSDCMVWAKNAMNRGIAATFGVVAEPLSVGIPHGQLVLLGLAQGYDWAESCYGGLQLAQRWTGVVFGDPLYAPFRSLQIVAASPPVIGHVSVKTSGDATDITAGLAGKTQDELADVALFRLEYGPTNKYGQSVEFFDWPEPEKSKNVKGRRFGYSRHFAAQLKSLTKGTEYHYRLTARNPAGLETTTPDATFKP